MNLAIVDIDGTLTQTTDIDAECYARAVSASLGHPISSDWGSYVHVTDSGILEEVFRKSLGRSPTAGESEAIESAFVADLEEALRRQPDAFAAVPGASEFLARSRAAGWQVALATGGWARSARLKLRTAGLPDDLPLASANDFHERAAIARHAIQKAVGSESETLRIVLVGDAPWDVKTARQLQRPFVGIASGNRARQLRSLGATHVFPGFSDTESLFAALDEAGVP